MQQHTFRSPLPFRKSPAPIAPWLFMTWAWLKHSLGRVLAASLLPIILCLGAAPALALDATFDYEASTGTISGFGSKTVTQLNSVANEELKAVSVNDNLDSTAAIGGTAIAGSESMWSSGGFFCETSVTFSLVSGKQFDLTSISLQDFLAQSEVVTLTSSKGTVTYNLPSGPATGVLNVAGDANAANMRGITSFVVTAFNAASSACGGVVKNYFGIGFDDIALQNITFPIPTVTAINPTAGPVGGGTAVTITGTNLTGATAVTIGGTAATGVTVVNATTITATTPAGTAGAQNVVVTTPGGTGTGTGLFTYVPAPTVTSINPTAGPAAGGTSVTITGTNFTGATSVTIGGTAATGVSVVNATTITATTPAGTAGAQNVVVTTPGGTGTGTGLFTYVPAPTVTSINPTAGPVGGGTSVTITGTNFTGATAVTIGGTAATGVTVVNATTITASTPAGTAGAQNVVVTTPGGTGTGTGLFTYVPAPTVTSINPTAGPVGGGTAVTITGTNLTGATAVTIGGTAATGVTVVNATTITATTPAGTAGAQNVVVTTPGGSGTGTGLFTYVPAPTVTAISPAAGATSGGTAVTITGTNLSGATAVTIGGTAATGVTVVNATTITATTPAGTAGAKNVAVTTPGGTGTGTGLFTYAVAPSVTSVAVPANGTYVTGGNLNFTVNWDQAVTVTGTPRIALTIGATTVYANYLSGSGAAATIFRYTVLSGQSDSDGIAVGALTLNGGTIQSASGIDAVLTLNSVGSTTAVLVDAVAPTLAAANIVVNNQADPHKVVLTFSEALASGSLGSAAGWTVTANGGAPTYSVASVALSSGNVVTLTLSTVDVTNAATTITNAAANAHLKVTPPATLTDLAGNTYAAGLVTEAGATHVLDSTAPTLSAVASSAPTASGGTLAATASEKALGYWIAVASGSTAPTAAQTQAGVNYGAVTVVAHGSGALPSATAGSITLTGLSASTSYDIYVAAQDAAGNLSVGVSTAPLTTAAAVVPNPFTPLTTPTVIPGIDGVPGVIDMGSGSAPAISNCMVDMLRQILGGDAVYLGQTATGEVRVRWNGQIISFYPLAANTTDARPTGLHTQSIHPLDAVTSCGTLNVTPALFNPVGFGAMMTSMGLTAQINAQGVITVLYNGAYYVVRPDFVVTTGTPGNPSLAMGSDGLLRFTDSNGNTQILRPAVLDPAALQTQVSQMGGSMVMLLDATVLVAFGNGQQFVLTPDLTLGAIPPQFASSNSWQDGPAHYSYRIMTAPYTAYRQGVSSLAKP